MTYRAPITRDEMRDAIQALHLILPKFALTEDTLPEIVDTYRTVLMPLDREAVREGMKLGLKGWDKFPTPHQWLDAAREWAKHSRATYTKTEETQRDAEGRAIICKVCRSVARSAWLRRADGSEYSRLIAPCLKSRHQPGDGTSLELPANFLMWDERTDAEHYADNARLTASAKGT